MTDYTPRVDRRETLKWLSAMMASTLLPRMARAADVRGAPRGYGQDPSMTQYDTPWPRLLSRTELKRLAVLSDLIIPGTAAAPAPSALGIPDFLDEWVSAPYPVQRQDREILRPGLKSLDRATVAQAGAPWLKADETARTAVLREFAAPVDAAAGSTAEPRAFFVRVRQLVVSAYYTTASGMRAVGYVGNVALPAYPAVDGELKAELERRMRELGI